MNQKDVKRNPLITVFYYPEGHITLQALPHDEVDLKNTDLQMLAICRWMARGLPSIVVKKFCDFTGADYEKILWFGTGTHDDEATNGRTAKLSKEQILEVAALRATSTAKELAAQYGVGIPTIWAVWARYGGASKRGSNPRLQGT